MRDGGWGWGDDQGALTFGPGPASDGSTGGSATAPDDDDGPGNEGDASTSSDSITSTDPTDPTDPTDTDPTASTGPGESCGDGEVQAPEECDDGNDDNTDACLDNCMMARCGDGYAQAGVEGCDDGENGIETDDCLTGCIAATCGDGVVWSGVEECDDGENGDDTDACITGCVAATCGDGHVQASVEECDDGGVVDGDGCDSNCFNEAITFSRSFTGGVAASAADCAEWDSFRASLQDDHASVTISSDLDGGRTCDGPEAAQICSALRTGTGFSVACDGNTWYVGTCTLGIELTADNAACTCQTPGYSVRPCIAHQDWGGVNTNTCNGPTQTITVSCGY